MTDDKPETSNSFLADHERRLAKLEETVADLRRGQHPHADFFAGMREAAEPTPPPAEPETFAQLGARVFHKRPVEAEGEMQPAELFAVDMVDAAMNPCREGSCEVLARRWEIAIRADERRKLKSPTPEMVMADREVMRRFDELRTKLEAAERELESVKDVLIGADEDFGPTPDTTPADVVKRLLTERDSALRELERARAQLAAVEALLKRWEPTHAIRSDIPGLMYAQLRDVLEKP